MDEETVNGISWEEVATDIIDQAVKEVGSGIPEEQVLDKAAHSIGEFYKDYAAGDSFDGKLSEMVADVAAEISDVFDNREDAAESLLSGISDDELKEDIISRMDDIIADRSVDASGSFGNIEFNASGDVISIDGSTGFKDEPGLTDVDIDALADELATHMDNVIAEPEFQDLLSGEDVNNIEMFSEADLNQEVDAAQIIPDDLSADAMDIDDDFYDPVGID